MWLSFSRPEYLLLLLPAFWLLWRLARGSYADLRGRRRTVAWALRIALVLCLVFAVAGAQFVKHSRDSVVVFAVDMSQSIPDAERTRALNFIKESLKARRSHDRAALVVFGRDAAVESENLLKPDQVRITSTPAATHTDIASALRLSLGLLSTGAAGRVVLLSDGNENVGSAVEEVLLAQASKVPVEVVPLRTRTTRDVLVKEVSVPSEARLNEPFPLRATLEATQPTDARVTVVADGRPVLRRDVAVAAGRSSLRLPIALPAAGFKRLDVLVETPDESCRENNLGSAFVRVKSKPRLLVVSDHPADAATLARSLRAQDIIVESGGPERLPTSVADLDTYDEVLLDNFPGYKMTDRQMGMFRDATRDLGIGLGMVGGELSFGAGGYYRTPIEEALPVTMDLKKDRAFPAAAMLLIIDTSGSMGMIEDGVEKIQLAAESACTAVDLLQPMDSVGVQASDPQPTMVADMRRVQYKTRIKNDIRSLRAGGGGIYCFPSLSLGYDLMKKQRNPVRHVVMLADGSDCDEQAGCVALAAEMAARKITVSTIAFGGGPDIPFLKEVAKAGRGHFYLTEKAKDLKKIFTRETLTIAKSVLVEERFYPRLKESTDIIEGVNWSATPPLLGYVATSAKGLAHTPLTTHKNDPLLAHWQYGLGKAIAFTSDAKPHWAAHWVGWPEFTRFWSQSVRWALRQETTGVLRPQVEASGDRAKVTVDATTEQGAYIDGLEIKAHVNQPDGGRSEMPLTQTGPGRYEAVVSAPASGAYVVGLEAAGPAGFHAQQTFGFAVPYPPDLADTKQNDAFLQTLAQQTGGRVITAPADVFTPPATMPRVPVDIWRFLLWAAALLLPFDVAVRRLIITREDLAPFVAVWHAARERLQRSGSRPAPERATTGQLLARKRTVREQATRPGEEVPRTPRPSRPTAPSEPAVPLTPPAVQDAPRPKPAATAPPPEPENGGDTTSRLLKKKRARKGE